MGINGPALGAVDNVIWQYTVTFLNQTPDVIDEIVVFYMTKAGFIQSKHETNWMPGERRVFVLGTCGEMVNYVIGVFIGNQNVAKMPATGNMTRELASQLNPTDRFMCEDSWKLEAQ